jgi:ribosomal protein S18 acetylase RimI-like enzyme
VEDRWWRDIGARRTCPGASLYPSLFTSNPYMAMRDRLGMRDACVEDSAAIAMVQAKSWRTTYQSIAPQILEYVDVHQWAAAWSERLMEATSNRALLVLEGPPGVIVGFAAAGATRLPGEWELFAIYILEEFQRRSGGRWLVSEIVDRARRAGAVRLAASVLSQNPSLRFYEALGFARETAGKRLIHGSTVEETRYAYPIDPGPMWTEPDRNKASAGDP